MTITPSTVTASEFGDRDEEYDERPYVRVRIQYPQGAFNRPTISCVGKIPIQAENIDLEKFDEEEYAGANLRIMRTTETVTTGADTQTINITVTEGTHTETAAFTITSASGEGYDINKSINF